MYTSGTQARDGRSVNHDEYPWVWPNGQRASHQYEAEDRYDPNPDFAVADNPILAAFRDAREISSCELGEFAGSWVYNLVNGYFEDKATDEQIEHARRVLARLVAPNMRDN